MNVLRERMFTKRKLPTCEVKKQIGLRALNEVGPQMQGLGHNKAREPRTQICLAIKRRGSSAVLRRNTREPCAVDGCRRL